MVEDPKLEEDKFGCEGDKFEVNIAGMESPVWDDGFKDNLRTIEKPGEYVLNVSNKFGCGDEQLFKINPTPKLGLKDTLIYEGQEVVLRTNLPMEYGPYTYEWQDGSIMPQFKVTETGKYILNVEDNIGCTAKDSSMVTVKPVGIESPNAFTPNSNNDNDRFYLKDINYDIQKFELYVYDRWGELLFKSNQTGYNGGWDGKYKGKLCPTGAYVWVAFINGKLTNKGTFMLVR
jgi:gliding motility-associated-like protein